MATYYKYVERNAKDRINWNEVGKSVSDMLQEETKVRLEKKAEIDENSRQFGIELANAPVGDYDHGNTFINGFATDMTEYRRMQDNLLKTGQLNLGEYTRNRQNNTDGTKLTFDLAKTYQEAYTDKMDRWKSGESQYREVYEMESVEGLANMRSTGSFINPTNGVISLATRDKNGGLDKNNTLTVAEMYGSIKRSYDAYDVNAAVKSEVDYLGDYITSDLAQVMRAGNLSSITQLTDQKKAPGYFQWENDTISSMMADTDHITSMLTNNLLQTPTGDKYTFTDNETDFINDKSGTLVYLDKSVDAAGKPVFQPAQETAVEDFLKNRIQQQIDVKLETQSAGTKPYAPPPSAASVAAKNAKKVQDDVLLNFTKLRWGTEEEKKTAANSIRGINTNIEEILLSEKGVTIKYYDAAGLEDQYLDYNDSNAAFAEAGINYVLPNEYKILDVNNVIKSAGLGSQQTIPMTTDVTVGGNKKAVVVKEPVLDILRRVLEEDGALSASTFTNEAGEMLNEDKALSTVADAIGSIPGLQSYTVTETSSWDGKNKLTLTSSVQGEPDIILDLDKQSAASLKDKLYAQAVMNIPKDETTLAVYTNGRGKSSGGMGKYVKP